MSRARELAELGAVYDSGALSNRNMIINGAMQVAQRATQVTGVNSAGYQSLDRMRYSETSIGTAEFTHEQVTDAPDGFANSLKFTCTTAEGAVNAGDACRAVEYRIEGQDAQQLQYGTSSAKKLTLSFHVKSSLTGTYTIALYRNETQTRVITATYTINSANTWEYKTMTFDGDTSSVITNDNARRLQIYWVVGAGSNFTSTDSTSWINYSSAGFHYGQTAQFQNTLNATWQVTGIQLELGTEATPFEHRSYGDELMRCFRYFIRRNSPQDGYPGAIPGFHSSSGFFNGVTQFEVEMRTTPSLTTSGAFRGQGVADSSSATGTCTIQNASSEAARLNCSGMSFSGTSGQYVHLQQTGGAGHVSFDAEL